MWIFVEGQGTRGIPVYPPPQLLGYLAESEDSASVLNIVLNLI